MPITPDAGPPGGQDTLAPESADAKRAEREALLAECQDWLDRNRVLCAENLLAGRRLWLIGRSLEAVRARLGVHGPGH